MANQEDVADPSHVQHTEDLLLPLEEIQSHLLQINSNASGWTLEDVCFVQI